MSNAVGYQPFTGIVVSDATGALLSAFELLYHVYSPESVISPPVISSPSVCDIVRALPANVTYVASVCGYTKIQVELKTPIKAVALLFSNAINVSIAAPPVICTSAESVPCRCSSCEARAV
jgi:hypothetical protein